MIHEQKSYAAARQKAARAYRGAEAERIHRFLPMVRRLAWHVQGSGRAGIEIEDLTQAGLVALTECARNHAGPGEDGFAAYAKMRVRGAMIDLIRRASPLTRGAGERQKWLRAKEDQLRLELGRDPSAEELAMALDKTPAELAELRASSAPLRFEQLEATYNDADLAFADDRPDSMALLEGEELREHLGAAIGALPERLQLVVQLYFVEELNLSEIASVLDVSVPRVHQLKAQALAKLRSAMEPLGATIP